MPDNWVERRYKREQNLKRAEELWQKAVAALQDCCKSFNALYSDRAKSEVHPSSACLIVTVAGAAFPLVGRTAKATIQFNANEQTITSKLESGPTVGEFRIEADEKHVFLTHGGNEISLDEFSRIAIESALFG
jgi:hypothetical protein